MENTNENRLDEIAEIQLTYKSNVKPSLRSKVSTSRDAFSVLKQTWDVAKLSLFGQFSVILTNRAQKGVSGRVIVISPPTLEIASQLKTHYMFIEGFLLSIACFLHLQAIFW